MGKICQRDLDGFVMPVEWALCIVALICKRKNDIRYCSYYRAVKILEHGMKVVETVLEKKLHRIVTVSEVPFGIMPESGKLVLCLS